jgi:hypothetical protein
VLQVAGAITFLRTENMYYPACSNKTAEGRQCNKKLHDNGDATWWVPSPASSIFPPNWLPLMIEKHRLVQVVRALWWKLRARVPVHAELPGEHSGMAVGQRCGYVWAAATTLLTEGGGKGQGGK